MSRDLRVQHPPTPERRPDAASSCPGDSSGVPPHGGDAQDRAAFVALYRAHVTPLYRYFYLRVRNVHDAEDLTATTFRKALASLHRYQEQGAFAAWLLSIARHTLRDHQRRRRRQIDIATVEPSLADPAPPPEARMLHAERLRTLQQLIDALPPAQREALLLRFVAGLRTAEAAATLGRSEGAVKLLVHRAITRLRATYPSEDA